MTLTSPTVKLLKACRTGKKFMFRWIHDTYRLTYVTTLLYDFVSNAEPCKRFYEYI